MNRKKRSVNLKMRAKAPETRTVTQKKRSIGIFFETKRKKSSTMRARLISMVTRRMNYGYYDY